LILHQVHDREKVIFANEQLVAEECVLQGMVQRGFPLGPVGAVKGKDGLSRVDFVENCGGRLDEFFHQVVGH
jgi:hypothetical protein